jgi:hypothetical protein
MLADGDGESHPRGKALSLTLAINGRRLAQMNLSPVNIVAGQVKLSDLGKKAGLLNFKGELCCV